MKNMKKSSLYNSTLHTQSVANFQTAKPDDLLDGGMIKYVENTARGSSEIGMDREQSSTRVKPPGDDVTIRKKTDKRSSINKAHLTLQKKQSTTEQKVNEDAIMGIPQ